MAGQKGIVRRGDTTTHGGKVLEGEPTFVFYGEPAAGVGHMVWCPHCKDAFPIIEGDPTFQAMGRAMALDGHADRMRRPADFLDGRPGHRPAPGERNLGRPGARRRGPLRRPSSRRDAKL